MPYIRKEKVKGKWKFFCGGCFYTFNEDYEYFLNSKEKLCPHCGKKIYPNYSDGTFPKLPEIHKNKNSITLM